MTLLMLLRPRRGYYVSGSVASTVAQFRQRAFVYKPQRVKRVIAKPSASVKKIKKAKARIAEIQRQPVASDADKLQLESTLNALRELEGLLSAAKELRDAKARAQQEAEVAQWLKALAEYVSDLRREILIEMEDEEFLLMVLAD
jgi:hypothetical protein